MSSAKKTVVLGVTGSIAAYKAAEIASALRKKGISVYAILTRAAGEFITAQTMETITGNPVVEDMFRRDAPWEVEHISLAKRADVFLVAPASANFIAKAAAGIADDMLTTTLLATRARVLIAPAMNTNMYLNPVVQQNIQTLKARGFEFINPAEGTLACGDTGVGRLAEVGAIVEATVLAAMPKQDLLGKKLIITAGPTREAVDPIRYISNNSSGKMGYALAEAALGRGAAVTLISGPVALTPPSGAKLERVTTTEDMHSALLSRFDDCDALIMAAAPADFTATEPSGEKIKKSGAPLSLALTPTVDILTSLAAKKAHQKLIGFAAETSELERNAKQKLTQKRLDMIIANDVTKPGVGFDTDTNAVTIYHAGGKKEELALAPKSQIAQEILDHVAKLLCTEA